jgi:hypothetical protein
LNKFIILLLKLFYHKATTMIIHSSCAIVGNGEFLFFLSLVSCIGLLSRLLFLLLLFQPDEQEKIFLCFSFSLVALLSLSFGIPPFLPDSSLFLLSSSSSLLFCCCSLFVVFLTRCVWSSALFFSFLIANY